MFSNRRFTKRLSLILAVATTAAYGGGVSIPLKNDNNVTWYGTISVGTPLEDFTVVFDTGRADLILPGINCHSTCDGHKRYDTASSSTAQDLGKAFNLNYGDGSAVSGDQVSDNVSIGGFLASGQTLGVATQYSTDFQSPNSPADGVLGMAFESISGFPAPPVMKTLISQGQLDAPVFAFKLAATGSELMVGGTNVDLYTGEFTTIPVTRQGFWQTQLDAIVVSGEVVVSGFDVIIDTGSAMITLTPEQAKQFYGRNGGKDASSTAGPGHYTFPCDNFPSVALTFGGKSFKMSKETLNLGKVSAGSTDCVGSIVGMDTGMDVGIIGTSFLQNVYTVFDIGNNQIGFADLNS